MRGERRVGGGWAGDGCEVEVAGVFEALGDFRRQGGAGELVCAGEGGFVV